MYMKRRLVSLITIMAMLLSIIPIGSVLASSGTTKLIVHYYRIDGKYNSNIKATSLDGKIKGKVSEKTTDEYGLKMTFNFASLDDNDYIGIRVKEDSVFPKDIRYVRSKNGQAEIWLIDGDARIYDQPLSIAPAIVIKKDNKKYVAVEDLTKLLNLTFAYGKNGYIFDGAAKDTVDILTIHHDRDYFEINVNTNKIGSNVTANMLKEFTDLVFNTVDGFKQDNKYYLSLGYIERLFQVATLVVDNNDYLLKKQDVAYDQITYAATPEQVGFSSEKLNKIDDYINQQIKDGFPAAAMIVVKDGKVVKESAYGYLKKYDTAYVNGE